MDIAQLLSFAKKNNASDLHLSPQNPPIIRVDGDLRRIKTDDILTNDTIKSMIYSVMTEDQRSVYEENLEIDFAISFGEDARFRVNAFTTRNGAAAVFRTIPTIVPSLEDLDPPPILKRLAEMEKGIILVTGPTGSGKSTTLAAMIDHINENFKKHIVTIEDPVEFYHKSKKSLINHRELGADTHSFSKALRSVLREDPDVILVGEMRDHETISLALTAAETGHLVLGTLHSNSAAKTIDRIIDVFPGDEKGMVRAMLSSSLQAVIAQTLMKRADGSGRVAAHEILVGTNAVRNLIRENQIAQIYSMIQVGARAGMQTMEDTVNALIDEGIVTKEEGYRVLLRDQDDNMTKEDAEKLDKIIDNNNENTSSRSHVSISSKSKDPSKLRGDGQMNISAPNPNNKEEDEDYSF